MNRISTLAFALVVCIACTVPGIAGKPKTSIGIGPILLRYPIVELHGEFLVSKDGSIAGIVGAGNLEGSTALEVGLQYNYYAAGNFGNGLQLGIEALYANVSPRLGNRLYIINDGLSIGLFIGYKVIADFGLTFNIQAGYAHVIDIHGEREYSSYSSSGSFYYPGSRSGANTGMGAPILHIKLGWSF